MDKHEHIYHLAFTETRGGVPVHWTYKCIEQCENEWIKTDAPLEKDTENVPGTWTRRNNVATYNVVAGKKIPRNR